MRYYGVYHPPVCVDVWGTMILPVCYSTGPQENLLFRVRLKSFCDDYHGPQCEHNFLREICRISINQGSSSYLVFVDCSGVVVYCGAVIFLLYFLAG